MAFLLWWKMFLVRGQQEDAEARRDGRKKRKGRKEWTEWTPWTGVDVVDEQGR